MWQGEAYHKQPPEPDETNPKDLLGEKKPPLHLFPGTALVAGSMVMKLGAEKYGPYNWRKKKVKYTVYVSAAMRHLVSALDGENQDPESGQLHLAHAMACCAILIDALHGSCAVDDRPEPGKSAELIRLLTGLPQFQRVV